MKTLADKKGQFFVSVFILLSILISPGLVCAQSILYWTGAADNDWNNGSNWSTTSGGGAAGGVPDITSYAVFDGDGPVNCTLSGAGNAYGVFIDDTYTNTVSLSGGSGIFTCATDFIQKNGTVNVTDSVLNIGGMLWVKDGELYDSAMYTIVGGEFKIEGGTFDGFGYSVSLRGTLTFLGGVFNAPQNLFVYSDFIEENGIFQNHGGAVYLNDTIAVGVTNSFYDLVFADSAYITMHDNTAAEHTVSMGRYAKGLSDTLDGNGIVELLNGDPSSLVADSGAGIVGQRMTGSNHISFIAWFIGDHMGTYHLPFVTDEGDNVSFDYTVEVPGVDTSVILFVTTWPTDASASPNNLPYTPHVEATFDTMNFDSRYAVDRYWGGGQFRSDSGGLSVGSLTLRYTAADVGGTNTLVESRLVAHKCNGTSWDIFHATTDTVAHTVIIDSVRFLAVEDNYIFLYDSTAPTVYAPPFAPAPQVICSNDTQVITFSDIYAGSVCDEIQWALDSGFVSSHIVASPATITVSVPAGQTDTVWIRSKDSGTGNVSVVVTATATVKMLPVTSVSPNNILVLQGQQVTLYASGGSSYEWPSLSLTTSSVTVFASTDSTYYTVNVTDSNGCASSDTALVRIILFPILSYTNYKDTINSGDSTDIAIYSTNPGTSVRWSRNNPTNVSGTQNGTGYRIKTPLVNNTASSQTVRYDITGNVGNYYPNPVNTDVVVRSATHPVNYTLGTTVTPPSSLTACADSTYSLVVESDTVNMFSIKLGFAFPPVSFSLSSTTAFNWTPGTGDTILINTTSPFRDTVTLYFGFTVPCAAIPNSSQIDSLDNILSVDVTNLAGVPYVGLSSSVSTWLKFPYLASTTLNIDTDILTYQHSSTVQVEFSNSASADFNGAISLDKTIGCTGVIRTDSIRFTVDSLFDTVFASPSFPDTIPHIFIPVGHHLVVSETDYVIGCIPNGGCTNTFILHWGCNDSSLCKTATVTRRIIKSDSAAILAVSRIIPVPILGDSVTEAPWDNACTNDSTHWEYVIDNSGNLPAYNTTIELSLDMTTKSYTYIIAHSITLGVDTGFPMPVLVDTASISYHYDTLKSGDFDTSFPRTDCFDTLSAHGTALIRHYAAAIPVLLPGQKVVLGFETYRCCPSDNAFNSGVFFNNWSLFVNGFTECDTTQPSLGGVTMPNAKSYTSTTGHVTHTYAFKPISGLNCISSDPRPQPNIELSQEPAHNNPNILSGGQMTCGTSEPFGVTNKTFASSISAQPNYNPLFFSGSGLDSASIIIGHNLKRQFRVRIQCQAGLQIDTYHPVIEQISTGVTWSCLNSSFTGTTTDVTAYFDMDSLPSGTNGSSSDFLSFFVGSQIRFGLLGCCPFTGNPNKLVTVSTYFNPNTSSCTDCWIPLSLVEFPIEIHCPGCVTPGIISYDSIFRVNLGYRDANDDGLPDGGSLVRINSTYTPLLHDSVFVDRAIVEDTLKTVTYSYFQEGDTTDHIHGFLYKQWQHYWDSFWTGTGRDSVRLSHLTIQHLDSNAVALGLTCYRAVLDYYSRRDSTHIQVVLDTAHITANGSDIFLFDVVDTLITDSTRFIPGDNFILTQYYTVCNNPNSVTELKVSNYVALTFDSVPGPQPFAQIGLAGDTALHGIAAHNPDTAKLYYCDEFFNKAYVYPVFRYFNVEGGTGGNSCNNSEVVHMVSYVAAHRHADNDLFNGYENVFQKEYRMIPGVLDTAYALGPLINNGTAVPVHFPVPEHFKAHINEVTTLALSRNAQGSIRYMEYKALQDSVNTVIYPTNAIVTGYSDLDMYVNPAWVGYTPPFPSLGFVPGTALLDLNIIISGKQVLPLGDEYFDQKIYLTLTARCDDSVGGYRDTIPQDSVYITLPGLGCAPTTDDVLRSVSTAASHGWELAVPSQTMLTTIVDTPHFHGSYVNWSVTFYDPQHATGYPSHMILFISDSLYNLAGLDSTSHLTDGTTCTSVINTSIVQGVDSNHFFHMFDLGYDQPFCLAFKLKNCDSTVNIPFSYSWSCDGYPDSLPPGTNKCFTPQTVIFTAVPVKPILNSVMTYPASGRTCDTLSFTAILRNATAGGVGNFIDTLTLPANAVLVTTSVMVGDSTDSVSATPSQVGTTNTWVIDTRLFTALDSTSSLYGVDGLKTDNFLRVSFKIHASGCNDTAIAPVVFEFNGTAYCGDKLVSTYGSPSIPLISCGPFVTLKTTDSSCTLGIVTINSVSGGVYPYTYLWSDSSTSSFIDSLHSGRTYSVTVTDALGCRAIDSARLIFADGDSIHLTYSTNGACASPDSIFSFVTNAVGSITYLWSNAATSQNVLAVMPGNYSVTATDINGCSVSDSVTVAPKAALSVLATGPTTNCDTGMVAFYITSPLNYAAYHWAVSGDSAAYVSGDTIYFYWGSSGSYGVTVTAVDTACHDSITQVLAITECCVQLSGGTRVTATDYIVSDIRLSQVVHDTAGGYQRLPIVSLGSGTGDSINTTRFIFINGTFIIDTDLVIVNAPHIRMGENARIVVTNHHHLSFTTSASADTTDVSACKDMWQGIWLEPQATVTGQGAKIRDADSAIYAHGGGTIDLAHTQFIGNFKAVVIDSITDTSAYPLTLDSVSFYTTASLPSPHSNPRCNVGIEVNNVRNIAIGNDTLGRNFFLSMDTAINIINSGAVVVNHYISGDAASGYKGIGIGVHARDNKPYVVTPTRRPMPIPLPFPINIHILLPWHVTTPLPFPLPIPLPVPLPLPSLNTYIAGPSLMIGNQTGGNPSMQILQCDTGIYVRDFTNSSVEIVNDTVHSVDSLGINVLVRNMSVSGIVRRPLLLLDIHDNNISSGLFGIYGQENKINTLVKNNIIDMVPSHAGLRRGICLINAILTTSIPADTVDGNTIIRAHYGIVCENRNSQIITNNTVSITNSGFSGFVATKGIWQTMCYGSTVGNNTVVGGDISDDMHQHGIVLDNANTTTAQCNELDSLGRGINADFPALPTGGGSVLLKDNKFNNSVVGIGVDWNGIIGPQGDDTTSFDNDWIGGAIGDSMIKTSDTTLGYLSPFYIRNSGTPITGTYLPSVQADNSSLPVIVNSITATNAANSCVAGTPLPWPWPRPPHPLPGPIIHLIHLLLADSIPYNADSTTYRLWDRYNLYVSLQFADTSILADSTVIDFIDSFQVSAMGKTLAMQVAIDTLNVADTLTYDSLYTHLNAVAGSNDFENNLKSYLTDYLLSKFSGTNSEIISAVNGIASSCVFTGGPAVLQARAFMMQVNNDLIGADWETSCSGSYKKGQDQKQVKEKPLVADYHLIPNLYKDNFTAKITLGDKEAGEVLIFAMDGRMMGRHVVVSGPNVLDLSADGLGAGIYLYKVIVNGEVKTNDKLVVVH